MSDDMPAFNLLADAFFPVRTRSGARIWLRLIDLRQEEGDYPVAFDWPRGDLNVAAFEFALGILSLAYQPEDHEDWTAIWRGRSPVDLAERLSALAFAFDLVGSGPRFAQDLSGIDGEANDVEALFIDTPGVNGQKKNADLLTHRGRFPVLGLKAAAIALHALQQFAPSGGAGNRTSLRGGGPMTTLVWPDMPGSGVPVPLWRVLLANLPLSAPGHPDYLDDTALARALPWLEPTITSEGERPDEIGQADPRAHPLQAFFGMPRRIRLVIGGNGVCPLTGETGPLVTGFIQKPWGVKYGAWRHPMTPYRQAKDEAPYSVKPKSSRFGYRDWVGAVVGRADKVNKAFPAAPVASLTDRAATFRSDGLSEPRLLAAGWAMNNMEAGTFLYSVQPLHLAKDETKADALKVLARAFADAGDAAANLLRINLRHALFGEKSKAATDSGVFEEATDAFFERTEEGFHAALEAAMSTPPPDGQDQRKRWLSLLRRTALDLFDRHATALILETPDNKVAMRVTEAYRRLRGALGEVGKVAVALDIEQPVGEARTKKARKGAGEAST